MKDELERRWGTIDLLDVLKEADHVTGFTDEFTSVASREITGREEVRRRLLLLLFGLGTNMGIKRIVDGANAARGGHGESEAILRRMRRLYISRDNFRRAVARLVNATLESATNAGGARAPPAPRTRRSSAPGRPTS